MNKTMKWLVSWATGALGLTLWFVSLWNQNLNGVNFVTQSVPRTAITSASIDAVSSAASSQTHLVASQAISCETEYVVYSSAPSRVLIHVQVYDNGAAASLPVGYLFYPQARINGTNNYVIQIGANGEGWVANVWAWTYTTSSALVWPNGELIGCRPSTFVVQ